MKLCRLNSFPPIVQMLTGTLTLLSLIACLPSDRTLAAPTDHADWRSEANAHLLGTPYLAPATPVPAPAKGGANRIATQSLTTQSLATATAVSSPWRLLGTASVVNTGENPAWAFQMTSQPDPSQKYGVTGGNIYYTPTTPFTFSQLSQLKLDWKAVTPWGGGSPRIAMAIDVNGDGQFRHWAADPPGNDGWLFVFIVDGYPKFYGEAAGWQNTGNYIGNESPSLYDSNQIRVDLDGDGTYDGTTTDNYSHSLEMVGNKQVMAIQVVTDGGWFTNSRYGVFQQVVWANNITVNNDVLTAQAPPNNAPVADDQDAAADEDTAQNITLAGTDADGNTLTYSIVDSPVHGTLSTVTGNQVTYTPNDDYNGADSFTFKVNDGTVDSNVATVSITINSVNDDPVTVSDSATTVEDTPLTLNVRANDGDADGDGISVTEVGQPGNGSVVINTNEGTITYTPNADFNGFDSFTYTISDGNGGTDTNTIYITITPANDAPSAANQSLTTNEDAALNIALASDVDGDTLTATIVNGPARGTLTGTGANCTYTPAANYNGNDSFSYKVSDGQANSNTVTVSITVNAINDAPVARPDAANVKKNQTGNITVLANDTDVEGSVLRLDGVTQPARGSVTINANRISVTYTPPKGFTGTTTFRYTMSDGQGGSATTTVTVTVN